MFRDFSLQTTWTRALAALVAGAVVGAVGISCLYLPGHWDIWRRSPPQIIRFWAEVFTNNLYYFGILLFLAGPPIWFLAHRFGFRTLRSAVFLGVGLSITALVWVVSMAFINDVKLNSEIKAMGNTVIVFSALVFPLTGAAIAHTIWRIAYRRSIGNA